MATRRPSVQVLLSTHNGASYLTELLQSIWTQQGVNVEVLVRDDGSTDTTLDLLRATARENPLKLVEGTNIGPAKSFMWLLEHSSASVDFVSFADQDDVWLPDKLSRATQWLLRENAGEPAMYCSALTLVDATLKRLGEWRPGHRGGSFRNAIVQNIASGCTIVINQAARELLVMRLPKAVAMHDWWVYQAVAGTGKVLVDHESRILYRQHTVNSIGATVSLLERVKTSWRNFAARDFRLPSLAQLAELERCFGDLWSPDERESVDRLQHALRSLRGRVAAAFLGGFAFQSKWHGLAFRTLLLAGRFSRQNQPT